KTASRLAARAGFDRPIETTRRAASPFMTDAARSPEPVLRTLSPLLHALERDVRAWLDGVHRQPLSIIVRASLEGMTNDLARQADALDVDRPILMIMLM